jgi:hypothetical protein
MLQTQFMHLSKSDFKLARQCITKLYYKKLKYPNALENDQFMQLLAEGGYMVGKLAQLLYPGVLVDKLDTAVAKSAELLATKKNICIQEATIESKGKLIRIDILNKKGNVLELIEVKAKSWNSAKDNLYEHKTRRQFEEYIEDVAFQYIVLKEAYPDYEIRPYLLMPDKNKRTSVEGLNGMFRLVVLPATSGGFRGFDVQFTGDEKAVRKDDLLTLVDVMPAIRGIELTVKMAIDECMETLFPKLLKKQQPLSIECSKCEYRLKEAATIHGFAECWGAQAFAQPHILTLTQLGNINRLLDNGINDAIRKGKASISDLDATAFKGKYNNRPYHQATATKELIERPLAGEINFTYPLCFIDFECSRMALPYHKGMRPYENVAFQWSCHRIEAPGADPVHTDWINTTDAFPNFKFAESLMKEIKHTGTVLIWSSYENTILKEIYEQMDAYGYTNTALKNWLEHFVKFDKQDDCGYVDLAAIACKYYHHPLCEGRYSVKYVLPAVLHETSSGVISKWLEQLSLLKKDPDGNISNPYELLPALDHGINTIVRDGTGAMRAYQDMLYGIHKDDMHIRSQWKKALRQYCRLDTLAMVIIWEYWRSVAKTGKVVHMGSLSHSSQ